MSFNTSLCIKPFSSSHTRRRRRRQENDPSSPKVGCLGQVRRCKAEEKSGTPPVPPQLQTAHSGSRRFYFLMASVAFFVSPMSGGWRAKKAKPALMGRRVVAVEEIEPQSPVAVVEMDPPLPVAAVGKTERETETAALSLWKRRCRSRKLEELFFCRQEKSIAGLVV